MNEKIVFGQYVNVDSWLHRLDPRAKLVIMFVMMIGIFLIGKVWALWALLGMFLAEIIVVATSRISFKKFFRSFRMILFLLFFTAAFQIVFNTKGDIILIQGYPLIQKFGLSLLDLILILALLLFYFLSGKLIKKHRWLLFFCILIIAFLVQAYPDRSHMLVSYAIGIHDDALWTALKVLLRVVNLVTLSALLTMSTKPTDINNGIEGIFRPIKFMKAPISIFAMEISIALRSIPELLNETNKVLKSQASRGVDFAEGGFKQKITQIVSLLVPMFVISYKKAEALANAMEARGYTPGADRTKIDALKYKTGDYLAYAFLILFIVFLILGKIKRVI